MLDLRMNKRKMIHLIFGMHWNFQHRELSQQSKKENKEGKWKILREKNKKNPWKWRNKGKFKYNQRKKE